MAVQRRDEARAQARHAWAPWETETSIHAPSSELRKPPSSPIELGSIFSPLPFTDCRQRQRTTFRRAAPGWRQARTLRRSADCGGLLRFMQQWRGAWPGLSVLQLKSQDVARARVFSDVLAAVVVVVRAAASGDQVGVRGAGEGRANHTGGAGREDTDGCF